MMTHLKTLEFAVNQRSARERVMLLLIGVLLVFSVWDSTFYQPMLQQTQSLDSRKMAAQTQLDTTKAQLNMILDEIKKDPTKSLREQRDGMLGQIQLIDKELERLTANLVSPSEMITLLKSMLEQAAGLQLIKMENIEPVALIAETDTEDEEKKVTLQLYQHGLNATFKGSFFRILEYLQMLEGIKKRIVWDSMTYQVMQYPAAELRLTIMTISDNRGYIGV